MLKYWLYCSAKILVIIRSYECRPRLASKGPTKTPPKNSAKMSLYAAERQGIPRSLCNTDLTNKS